MLGTAVQGVDTSNAPRQSRGGHIIPSQHMATAPTPMPSQHLTLALALALALLFVVVTSLAEPSLSSSPCPPSLPPDPLY